MDFWGKPNWHVHGLPTPEELRAENQRRSFVNEMELAMADQDDEVRLVDGTKVLYGDDA